MAKLKITEDVSLVYQSIDTLAKLSDAELPVVYQELKTILGTLSASAWRKIAGCATSMPRKYEQISKG